MTLKNQAKLSSKVRVSKREEEVLALIKGDPTIGIRSLKSKTGIKSNSYISKLIDRLIKKGKIGEKIMNESKFTLYD